MGHSLALSLYLTVSQYAGPWARRHLAKRVARGKEDPDRLDERFGISDQPRPDGPLIWFHAASVGESVSLISVIERLLDDEPRLSVLLTTGTRSSADMMQKRLPRRAIHQFAPMDARPFVRAFLDHWRPDLAAWTESELWPAMLHETAARGCPMVLLNARMSERSYLRWRRMRGAARSLLRRFSHILVQDEVTFRRLGYLGAPKGRMRVSGTLKQTSGALPHDEAERQALAAQIATRPVWLAASTHPGEEEVAAQAHALARRQTHRLVLIIAPRHPERGDAIAADLRAAGWIVAQRSKGEPFAQETEIYLADTLGEMGLWYRLAPVSFVGGSLVPIGGHNPFEPAALGSAILHGPHVASALEIYDQLGAVGAARQVHTAEELSSAVLHLLEPHNAAAMAHAAWELSSSGAKASDEVVALLHAMLDEVEQ